MSGDFFLPSLTITTLSESKSYAKPISFVFLINSSRVSTVGSGPRDEVSKFSFIVFTSQPIRSSYVFANENKFFVYPNNYNSYVKSYKDSFQHGGISLEEMFVPYSILESKN